ncbi:hypothetical protein [Polaribacter sp. Hel_I_88]|uniref:hypothetical protein n=1 Tax=Polaribacter sp. Hel_I_88 TaxID=1250006 RepID=UPI00047E1FB7|nr:hypothetical protein [Polaribacter sp. Hel_I_88]
MDIQTTKIELAKQLLNTDNEAILKKIKDILINSSEQNNVVAYTIDGKSLSAEEFQSELYLAEKEAENGNYLTSQELDNEIASWNK